MTAARGTFSPPRPLVGVLLTLLACAPPASKSPASDAPPPVTAPPPPSGDPTTPALPTDPHVPRNTPPPASTAARECDNGELLDSGCTCRSGGACFDICCGPQADCAHPAEPGGASACMLRMNPQPPEPAKPCTDGQALSDGCTCAGKTCMDICCVGTTCSHHASAAGGWAKCRER